MVDACIRESQRLYPVAPFVVRHLTSDLHLKDGEQKHRSPIFLQFLRSRSLPDLSPGIFQRIFFRTEISPGVFQRFFFVRKFLPEISQLMLRIFLFLSWEILIALLLNIFFPMRLIPPVVDLPQYVLMGNFSELW